jgi:hypothetical protein
MTLAYATYLTADDVRGELKNINFTTNTNITAAQIDDLVDRTQAAVDGWIAIRYTVPILPASMPQSALVLKDICMKLAAGRIDRILRNTGINMSPEVKAKVKELETTALDMIQEIKEDKLLLVDAARKTPVQNSISGSHASPPITTSLGINAVQNGTNAIGFPPREIDINRTQW